MTKPKLHEFSHKEYKQLKESGMMWEIYPEATGDYTQDVVSKNKIKTLVSGHFQIIIEAGSQGEYEYKRNKLEDPMVFEDIWPGLILDIEDEQEVEND